MPRVRPQVCVREQDSRGPSLHCVSKENINQQHPAAWAQAWKRLMVGAIKDFSFHQLVMYRLRDRELMLY